MWIENLYRPAEILVREHERFPIGEHTHSFYELAYIVSGSGSFSMPEGVPGQWSGDISYGTGTLLLIPPERLHRFKVGTRSRYLFIRFTGSYVTEYIGKDIEQALRMQDVPRITPAGRDASTLQQLMEMVTSEQASPDGFSAHLQQQWINSIITLAARSAAQHSGSGIPVQQENDRAVSMLQYIQRHIHQPERLKGSALCAAFNLSPAYIGRYFKRHFHESLRQYIVESRIRAAAEMLCNSRMSVKEIAYRLGYTDSCHLVRSFKHHYGTTPASYRSRHASGQEMR